MTTLSPAQKDELLKLALAALKTNLRYVSHTKDGYRYEHHFNEQPIHDFPADLSEGDDVWIIDFHLNMGMTDQGLHVYLSLRRKKVLLVYQDGA